MKYVGNKVEDIKIAYIGGGSRGWAWNLMSDLAEADDICGQVALYDIDFEAAKNNEIIGNMYKDVEGANSVWEYTATKTIDEALDGANFVVISIQPATFDEIHGVFGFRTGTPKLKTLKGFTWASVLTLCKEYLQDYVRATYEVAKDKLLADRDKEEVNENFEKVGIMVAQDETFYMEPKKEDEAKQI